MTGEVGSWRENVERAVGEVRRGRPEIVTDDEDRENEGDLITAAQDVDEAVVAFLIRNTSGIICVPMTASRLDELRLDLMVRENSELHGTAFTVSVDHVSMPGRATQRSG